MKKLWVIPMVVVLAAGGVLGWRSYSAQQQQTSISSLSTLTLQPSTITSQVGASGTVRAKQTATLTWLTSGKVGQVNAALGDAVKQGQTLASLNPATLPPTVLQAQADLISAQQALDTLQSSSLAQAQAQQALAQAQQAYTTANNTRQGMNYPRASQNNLTNAQTQADLANAQLARAQAAYNKVSDLPDTDIRKVQALNALTSAQKARDTAQATYNWLSGKPTSQDLANADAALAVAKAQLDDAQRAWDKVKNGPSADDLAAAQAKVNAAKASLAMAQIVAPFNGVITEASVQSGDLVSPGTTAFRIDDLSALYVDVQISEVDINKIQPGAAVSLTLDAIPNKTYHGKVTQLEPVGAANSQGVVNFNATIQLTDADAAVKPGMTVTANIVAAQANHVLAVPNSAIQVLNNQHIVYLLANNRVRPVRVQIGLTSDTMSQVESTLLKAGDKIVLNPPSNLLAQQRQSNNTNIFGSLFRLGRTTGGNGNFNNGQRQGGFNGGQGGFSGRSGASGSGGSSGQGGQ